MVRSVLSVAVLTIGTFLAGAWSAQAQNLVPCAREQGFCRVPYPTRVIYGVPGNSVELFVRGRGIPCSNEVFGDPAPGTPKRCAYVARGPGRGYDDGFRGNDRRYGDRYREDYGRPDYRPEFRDRPYDRRGYDRDDGFDY